MRIRSVWPHFWEDEAVGSLSLPARLLYIGTWSAADDEGLLIWSPEYLKAECFRWDDNLDDVAKWMRELEDIGFVFTYPSPKSRAPIAFILRFHDYQRPNRPTRSKLPAPDIDNPTVRDMYLRRDKYQCHVCKESVDEPSIILEKPRRAGGTDYPSNVRVTHAECAPSERSPSEPIVLVDAAFDRFWGAYPRHVEKATARRAFEKALTRASLDAIIAGAERYKNLPTRSDRYTKHPSTWLNGDCWHDEHPSPARDHSPEWER